MEIIFIVHDILGGVAYLNFDIINNLSISNKPYIRVILMHNTEIETARYKDDINADEVQTFTFSPHENAYYLRKRLSKLIGNQPGIIVCNDGLELNAIWCEGTSKTVFNIVHDNYNYELSKKFHQCIDVHLCHSRYYEEKIKTEIGGTSIFYKHGISIPKTDSFEAVLKTPKLCFIGRLIETKGVMMLKNIHNELLKQNITPIWRIIGSGPLKEKLQNDFKNEKNISFYAPDYKNDVLELIKGYDFFIFPSVFEGFGIALVEAAAMGVIPIVQYIEGGFHEVSQTLEAEIIYETSNIEISYATIISDYVNNKKSGLNKKCMISRNAAANFDIRITSNEFFNILLKNQTENKIQLSFKPHHNFQLDRKFFPNLLVILFRKIKNSLK